MQHTGSVMFLAVCGNFSSSMQDLIPQKLNPGSLHWERGVLGTGPPRKSLSYLDHNPFHSIRQNPNWNTTSRLMLFSFSFKIIVFNNVFYTHFWESEHYLIKFMELDRNFTLSEKLQFLRFLCLYSLKDTKSTSVYKIKKSNKKKERIKNKFKHCSKSYKNHTKINWKLSEIVLMIKIEINELENR